MWVGGRHPDWLPKPVRSAVVGDTDTAVVREAIDRVNRTYYRKIPKNAARRRRDRGHRRAR